MCWISDTGWFKVLVLLILLVLLHASALRIVTATCTSRIEADVVRRRYASALCTAITKCASSDSRKILVDERTSMSCMSRETVWVCALKGDEACHSRFLLIPGRGTRKSSVSTTTLRRLKSIIYLRTGRIDSIAHKISSKIDNYNHGFQNSFRRQKQSPPPN